MKSTFSFSRRRSSGCIVSRLIGSFLTQRRSEAQEPHVVCEALFDRQRLQVFQQAHVNVVIAGEWLVLLHGGSFSHFVQIGWSRCA